MHRMTSVIDRFLFTTRSCTAQDFLIFVVRRCSLCLRCIAHLSIRRSTRIAERGAFRHISLSSFLPRQQYLLFADRVWSFDSVQ
jgi:hypothetical protein